VTEGVRRSRSGGQGKKKKKTTPDASGINNAPNKGFGDLRRIQMKDSGEKQTTGKEETIGIDEDVTTSIAVPS